MHGGTNPGAPFGNRRAFKHGARSGSIAELLAKIHELTAAGNAVAEHSTTMTKGNLK